MELLATTLHLLQREREKARLLVFRVNPYETPNTPPSTTAAGPQRLIKSHTCLQTCLQCGVRGFVRVVVCLWCCVLFLLCVCVYDLCLFLQVELLATTLCMHSHLSISHLFTPAFTGGAARDYAASTAEGAREGQAARAQLLARDGGAAGRLTQEQGDTAVGETLAFYNLALRGVCDTPELWRGAAGLCARVRACAGAAESLHTYIVACVGVYV